jgi:DNA helicase HerA-like ATPase
VYRIYEWQRGTRELLHPHYYIAEDIEARLPVLVATEPPLNILYPVLHGGELDPYAVYIGVTAGDKPFAFNPRHVVNPLVLVVGVPGAGKSSLVKTLVYGWVSNEYVTGKRQPPVIIADPEGEYSVLASYLRPGDLVEVTLGTDYINIFERPVKTIKPLSWYMRILPVLEKFLNLTERQAPAAHRVLKRVIVKLAQRHGFTDNPETWRGPDITLEEVYHEVEALEKTLRSKQKLTRSERIEYQGASTLLRRLDTWMYPPFDAFARESTFDLSRVFDYRVVVFNARLIPRNMFDLFTTWLVNYFYGLILEMGPLPSFGIRMVLVLDEAWALLKKSESREANPLEELARRGRKYGIMIVAATQTPEDMDEKMFSLFGTVVTGSLLSDRMVKKLVASRGMPKRFETIIKMLPRGWLVWHVNWASKDFPYANTPLVVRVDYPIRDVVEVE